MWHCFISNSTIFVKMSCTRLYLTMSFWPCKSPWLFLFLYFLLTLSLLHFTLRTYFCRWKSNTSCAPQKSSNQKVELIQTFGINGRTNFLFFEILSPALSPALTLSQAHRLPLSLCLSENVHSLEKLKNLIWFLSWELNYSKVSRNAILL